jgi:hypothetical protein
MVETIGNKVCPVDTSEFAHWFDRAHEPWKPITAAKRQLDALIEDTETPPVLAAHDHLYDVAGQAVRWLELNSCPDKETGGRLKAQMIPTGLWPPRCDLPSLQEATTRRLLDWLNFDG